MKVRRGSLDPLRPLGSGGFAQVYEVTHYTLPGDPTRLAYKEFTIEVVEQARSAEACVDFRQGLSLADQGMLDSRAVWPRALVTDNSGAVCGLLMPLIPPQFFFQPSSGGKKDRAMSWLASSEAQRKAAGVDDVPLTERLALLAQMTYVISWLHKQQWVFGDLSFSNAVYAQNPPRMMLLDCDSAAALSDRHRKQASTPFWDPPECPIQPVPGVPRKPQDDVTDTYKLGLALLRCLTPGKGAATSRDPARIAGELDATGVDLVTRALSGDRSTRPTAKELYTYLRTITFGRVSPPEIKYAWLVSHRCPRGRDVRIEWQLEHARDLEIQVGGRSPVRVDLARNPHGCSFRARESGRVSLEVSNKYGTVPADLGDLTLFDLPDFRINVRKLPALYVPEIETFHPPGLDATLAGRPPSPAGVDVITMPELDIAGMVNGLLPDHPPVALPPIGGAAHEASNAVTDIIHDARHAFDLVLRSKAP